MITANPYTRILLRRKIQDWLQTVPREVTSNGHAKLFTELSGLTQTGLKKNWDGGGKLTSCNSFIGQYSLKVTDHKLKQSLAMFDLEGALKKVPGAWVNQKIDLTARPEYGDIVRWSSRLHVGVSLEFEGALWHTIEGGQGGRMAGFDKISRKTSLYNPAEILGWVDMAAVLDWLDFGQTVH